MVKLRLKRMGSINKPFYRIVTLDSRKKRDGAYLESIGYYDPKTDPFTLKVDGDRAIHWLNLGAQPSDTVRSLLKKAGILQKWHEMKLATKSEETDVEEKKEAKKKTKKAVENKKTAKPKAEKKEEVVDETVEVVVETEKAVEAAEKTVDVAIEADVPKEEPVVVETKTEAPVEEK
jgi:small subunit ribosomal protein S16